MALGVRVSKDETVNSVVLDSTFAIHFMPPDLPVEGVREVQNNFRIWIIGNALRELDQATSIFADRVFESRTLVEFHGKPLSQEALDSIEKFKAETNVAAKLGIIAQRFGIDSDLLVHMRGLSKARNALSHNFGNVGERHTTHEGELRLSWLGFEVAVGERILSEDFEQFRVEKDTPVTFRALVRERTVPLNAPIELSPYDLSEICMTYWVQAQKIISALQDQVRELLKQGAS